MVNTQRSHLGLFPSAGATQTWKPTSPWQANLRPSKALNSTGSCRLGLPQICGEIQIQFCAVLLSAIHETWDVTFINGIRALTAPALWAGGRSRFLAWGHFVSEEAATDVGKEEVYLSDLAHVRINCDLTLGGDARGKFSICRWPKDKSGSVAYSVVEC